MEGGYNLRNPAVKRLMREAQELKDKTEQFSAYPLEDNLFEWHFTIRGPADSDFENGVYHGRIILPPEYPMKPPSIILLTPSGRFETNRKICLSISGFHPESWQPSWSLRTALLGIIGFMPTHGNGAIGSLDYTPEERKLLARKSQDWRCPQCGPIKDLVMPITELSKELTKEAKELGQQISMQAEKQKPLSEAEATGGGNVAAGGSSVPEPVSSTQQTRAVTTSQPAVPSASTFYVSQRNQAPGTFPNIAFPFPPVPFVMPQFPFQFPGVSSQAPSTSNSGQTSPQSVVNPYLPFLVPPPLFMPNIFMNPNQIPTSVPNVPLPPMLTPNIFSGAYAFQQRTTQLATSPNMSTVVVSSQTSSISSTVTPSNTGARPKEPPKSVPQPLPAGLAKVESPPSTVLPELGADQASSSKEESNSVQSNGTVDSAKKSLEMPEAKTTLVEDVEAEKPAPAVSTPVTSAPSLNRMDDGDPVPLASTLRQRARTTGVEERASLPRISMTNVSAEPVAAHRPRYTTRVGIMDAMADVFVIILLFCIFGLLARRVSMFI